MQDRPIAEHPLPPFATEVPRRRRGPLVLAVAAVAVVTALVVVGLTGGRSKPVEEVETTSAGGPSPEALAGRWLGPDGAVLPDGSGPDGKLVVASAVAPARCGWTNVVLLHLADPIGRPTSDPIHTYQYVRDPDEHLSEPPLRSTYDADADLPTGAASTGFTHGEAEIWTSPETFDRAVFVVLPDHVERWPWATPAITCD